MKEITFTALKKENRRRVIKSSRVIKSTKKENKMWNPERNERGVPIYDNLDFLLQDHFGASLKEIKEITREEKIRLCEMIVETGFCVVKEKQFPA